MIFKVRLVPEAETDIVEIHAFIEGREGVDLANKILAGLDKTIRSLDKLPRRGHTPPELEGLGLDDVAEIHFKPYRIIYEVSSHRVFIHCILDGRRDLPDILQERLVR